MSASPLDSPRQALVPPGWTMSVFARVPDARLAAWAPDGSLLVGQEPSPVPGSVGASFAGDGIRGCETTTRSCWYLEDLTGSRSPQDMVEQIGVADAKRRFSELADRVGNGESFLIVNRGRPVLALVPPQRLGDDEVPPVGLAAFAGALAGDWDSVDEDMGEIVAARQHVVDRPPPDLS